MPARCIQYSTEAHLNDEKQLSCIDNELETVMDEGLWIPIASFAAFTIVIVVWVYYKYKTRLETQQTFRLALEKGNELSPDFIKQLAEPEPSKDRDLRRSLIWLAIGAATALFGVMVGEEEAVGPLLGIAAFPTLVGAAYLTMWRFGARKD